MQDNFDLLIIDLDIINYDLYCTLKILFSPLLQSETIHDNCFIFSECINLTWDLCYVGSFGIFLPLTVIL